MPFPKCPTCQSDFEDIQPNFSGAEGYCPRCKCWYAAKHEPSGSIQSAEETKRENDKLREALTKIANHDRDWNRMWAAEIAHDALQSMTSRRLFLAKMVGLAGSTLLAKADYTKPLSLPVVLTRVEDYKGDSGKIVLDFSAIDFDRLLYCIAEVETGHKDHLIGPSGERSKYQIKRSVWEQHWGKARPFTRCRGDAATGTAHDHARWLSSYLGESVPWLAQAWRNGLDATLSKRRMMDFPPFMYAARVTNLYNDPTYQHT